ncbi:MAG: DUF262 domain-containing protein [Desulfococcaceae bacterium]
MALSEIIPSSVKIDKLLSRIEEGDIKVPAFQRGFVWEQEKVIELLDSIYNDYPIGSILLWNTVERLKSTRNIGGFLLPDRPQEYPHNYVLDGQQRLTAIYASFCKNREIAPHDNDEYNIDTEIFDVYIDLDEKNFLSKNDLNEEHIYLKISTLFNVEEFFEELEKMDKQYRQLARDVQSKFQNYEIPIVTTNKRSKEELGYIFERINNTGTKLTTLDLMVAWSWGDDFHLREQIKKLLNLFKTKGFEKTSEKVILQCLSSIVNKTTRTKDILSIEPSSVRNKFSLLEESLQKSVDFLLTELNVISRDFLPHSHQIVPLTYFFSKVTTPNEQQSKIIKQWFWKTSFSKRYAGGTDTKMNEDISFFDEIIKNNFSNIMKYSYNINEINLINQIFNKGNPYTRSFLLLMAHKKPYNLVNGNSIDLGRSLSKYNLKEYHHIFPASFLKKRKIDIKRINSICNFCFLPSDSNKKISSRSPSEYMFNLVPENEFTKILESNLMPLEKDIYLKNDYDNFLEQRSKIIIQYLDSQLS